ncbi:MAG: DUF3899 domain-containing protein [Lachnospiraceae bacterium]|nr:DUF3899 domain-containing protein [Lachnospiraceae bacterium]
MSKLRWILPAVAGVTLILLYLLWNGFFSALPASDRVRLLSDGFFLVGMLLLAVGVLFFVRKQGGFDGLGYGLKRAGQALRLRERHSDTESYGDYLMRMREEERSGGLTLVLPGLFFLLIATVLTFVFHLYFDV